MEKAKKCKFSVKDKTGEYTESILYQNLEKYYLGKLTDPLELVNLYNKVSRVSKDGKKLYANRDLEIFIQSLGLSIDELYDENNQLQWKHAVKYLEERRINQEIPQPLGATLLSYTRWQTKARELTADISKRIEYLKNKKFTTREKAENQRLLKQLLEVQSDVDYVKGLESYISVAAKEMAVLVDKINKKGVKGLNARDLQEMQNIVDNYSNIEKITRDARKEMSLLGDDSSAIGAISKVMLKRLEDLLGTYDTLKTSHYETALRLAVKMLTASNNGMVLALREEVRRAYLDTEEGKKKEKEKTKDYHKRVQQAVEDIIIEKKLYDEKETALFFENLFRTGDDISWVSRWALQGGNTSSTLLRSLNAILLKSENSARNMYNSKMAELDPLVKEYKKYMKDKGKSTNSVLELYENINELYEGEATGYYVGKTSSIWSRQKAQIKRYIQDYRNELQRLESENLSETPKFWDEELDEAVREDDKNRLIALAKAEKGELNKRYNEEDDLQGRYDKLVGITKELTANRKKFRTVLKEYRALKNKATIEAHNKSVELEELRKIQYRLTDSYTGFKNEYEFEIFRRHYDVVALPNLKSLNGINALDKSNLENGKTMSGAVGKNTLKIVIPDTVSDYLSPQFKHLDKLRKEDPDNIEWRYYKAIMNTVALSERQYSETYRTYFKKPEVGKTGAERWESDVDSFLNFGQVIKNYVRPVTKEKFLVTAGVDYDLNYENTLAMDMQENGYKVSQATKQLPVYFKETGMDPKNQSSNIHHVVLSGYNTAIAYKQKYEILPMVEIFLFLLENRKTTGKSASSKLMHSISKAAGKAFLDTESYMERVTEEPGKSDKSRIYNNAVDMVNTRLFGQSVNSTLNINLPLTVFGRPDLAINFRKLWKLFASYVSTTVLSLNIKSGAANVIYGEFQYMQEVLGNEFIGGRSWAQSQLDYLIDFRGIVNDIGKDYPTSKTNLLGLIFDPLNDYNPLESDYKHTNKAYAVFNMDSLHGINTIGEHIMQLGTMGGVLRETKVVDKDGNYLTKNGTTKDRKLAMSFFESFEKTEMSEDSYEMVTDSRVAGVEIKKGTRLERMDFVGGNLYNYNLNKRDFNTNRLVIDTLTNLIQSLNEEMHGPYSWRTAPPMKRTFLGGLLLQMRQWFPTGMAARWAGVSNEIQDTFLALAAGKGSEHFQNLRNSTIGSKYFDKSTWGDFTNMGPSQKFDDKRGTFTGGRNASVVRQFQIFGYHVFLAFKQLFNSNVEDAEFLKQGLITITAEQWRKMEDREKANIKKVAVAAASRTLLSGFAAMLLAGDDDDERYYKLAFYTTRLQTELAAYSDKDELFRLLQSPAVTLSMYNRIILVMMQLQEDIATGEYEIYQSGSKKGRTKIGKALKDMLPFGKVFEQHKYIEDILNYHYKGQVGLVKK
tara:strand:- start:60 stop:4289 length:4230 start_codon:yes stop_codon:yes gene_type:complete